MYFVRMFQIKDIVIIKKILHLWCLLKPFMLNHLASMFFPSTCKACNKQLLKNESIICLECEFHLPQTGYHKMKENPIAKNFWGRANIHYALAMYFFDKGDKLQKLLHQLKYKGQKEVGVKLGKLFGTELKNGYLAGEIDFIVPVPLHKKKLRLRGYNQSELIAQGISQTFNLPVLTDTLIRKTATDTQTRKSRFERFENVDNVFEVKQKEKVAHKHILLIDDVITTGSTIAACAEAFSTIDNCKVSVAAIAFAHT